MTPKKLHPRRLSPAKRCRLDTVILQNPLHRVRRALVAEVGQSSLDSIVAPRRVRLGHAKDQFLDLRRDGRTSCFAAKIRPLPRDELTVPAKDCIRSDQSRQFLELLSRLAHEVTAGGTLTRATRLQLGRGFVQTRFVISGRYAHQDLIQHSLWKRVFFAEGFEVWKRTCLGG